MLRTAFRRRAPVAFTTNDLCDKYFKEVTAPGTKKRLDFQVADPTVGFRHFGGQHVFEGEIVTVKCLEDNSRVKELASTAGNGRVMVVDGGASLRRALLGDMIAKAAMSNGWAGFVINGAVRDVDELIQLRDLGVYALGAVPIKTDRKGAGEVGCTLTFAGLSIEPQSWLLCDETGLVVMPARPCDEDL